MADTKFNIGKKSFFGKLLILGLVVTSIVISTTAVAEYKKPTTTSNPNPASTTTTATRNLCSTDAENTLSTETFLTALAPYSHRGQTVSSHPTFVWFVPDSDNFPVDFQLHEYDEQGNRTLKYQVELDSTPGIMQLSLPLDKPGLSVGKAYRWQVAILCDLNHPSKDIIVRAELDVVTPTPELEAALNAANNSMERANIYADFGLWYDAIATALSGMEGESSSALVVSFLSSLAQLEKANTDNFVQEQGHRLELVVDNL